MKRSQKSTWINFGAAAAAAFTTAASSRVFHNTFFLFKHLVGGIKIRSWSFHFLPTKFRPALNCIWIHGCKITPCRLQIASGSAVMFFPSFPATLLAHECIAMDDTHTAAVCTFYSGLLMKFPWDLIVAIPNGFLFILPCTDSITCFKYYSHTILCLREFWLLAPLSMIIRQKMRY